MLAALYPSSRAATGIGNGLFIVIMMTSGAFVPQSQSPQGVQRVARYSPFHYLVDLLQGMWSGRSWTDYGPALAVLIGMTVVCGLLGARLFRWKTA